MRARHLPRLAAVLVLAGAFLVATASPAWAHATLESSSPTDGATLTSAPSQITLTYDENVEIPLESVRLLSCSGQRITIGAPHHGKSAREIVVGDIPHLETGTYLVPWRVISADSHPVQGAISFQIGSGSAGGLSSCSASLTSQKSSTTVGVLFGATRFMLFAGLALLIGGVVFLLLIARGTSAARGARIVAWVGFFLTLAATVLGVMLQGPYAAGSGIGDALKWSVIDDILHTRYGHISVLRIAFLAIAFVLLLLVARSDSRKAPPAWWWVSAVLVGLGLAATPGLAGHAATGNWTWLAVPLDTAHVLAMSIWMGGLVALLATALGGGFSGGLRRALIIFSRLAFWCVIVLITSGIFASWRQVGFSVSRYTDTDYGRLLLVKIGIVVGIVALAAVSRSIVRKRRSAPLDAPDSAVAAIDERTAHGLRRSVGGEVLLGLAVLVVTALLVNSAPARTAALNASKVYSTTLKGGSGADAMLVNVTIDPARAGVNTMHVYTLTPQGLTLTIQGIGATFAQAGNQVPVNLHRAGPNHFLANRIALTPGKWQLVIQVHRTAFDTIAVTTTVPIR